MLYGHGPARLTRASLYWVIGIVENEMEITIMGHIGYILGLYWGYMENK